MSDPGLLALAAILLGIGGLVALLVSVVRLRRAAEYQRARRPAALALLALAGIVGAAVLLVASYYSLFRAK
jgi:hypothetical protein